MTTTITIMATLTTTTAMTTSHGHDHHHGHGHDHDHSHQPLIPGADDCYVSPRELRGFFFAWLRRLSESVGRVRSGPPWLKPEFYREFLPAREDAPSPKGHGGGGT